MRTHTLSVSGRTVQGSSTLVRTSVGVDWLHIGLDSGEWADFDLSVVFNGTVAVPVEATEEDGAWSVDCEIPREAMEALGAVQVTLHGTKPDGRHIITQRAFPLTVIEEGDGIGADPLPNP